MTRPEQRPIQHRVGDQATSAVAAIWSSTGAAVEHVQKDYGEDLLVQPCHGGKMDPSRIWVQVKGTRSASRRPRKAYVRNRTILRWARTTDLTVIVYWNVTHNAGWYAEISPSADLASLLESMDLRTAVTFHRENDFDAQAAELLALSASLAHADNELLIRYAWRSQSSDPQDKQEADPAIAAITMSAMATVGICRESTNAAGSFHLTQEFVDTMARNFEERSSDAADTGEALLEAALQAVLEFGRVAVRRQILEDMTITALTMLRPTDGWPMPVPWE
jgi:hypothetical protein